MRLQLQQTIDNSMQKHIDEERKKWKAILESVVDVILFLSKQNLPFRGHREAFESSNQRNSVETVKLLAKYSPALSKHLSDIRISKKMTTTRAVASRTSLGRRNKKISGGAKKMTFFNDIAILRCFLKN